MLMICHCCPLWHSHCTLWLLSLTCHAESGRRATEQGRLCPHTAHVHGELHLWRLPALPPCCTQELELLGVLLASIPGGACLHQQEKPATELPQSCFLAVQAGPVTCPPPQHAGAAATLTGCSVAAALLGQERQHHKGCCQPVLVNLASMGGGRGTQPVPYPQPGSGRRQGSGQCQQPIDALHCHSHLAGAGCSY